LTQSDDRRKRRVLVVDDYHDAAEITSSLVRLMGHESRVANTGRAALEEASRFAPEIVILDLGLPDIGGFDVARTLRIRAAGRPLHIAALTGWMQPWAREAAFAAGIDQYFVKPGNLEALLERAMQGLAETRSR
jgi:CheY-like chemotaxis protein